MHVEEPEEPYKPEMQLECSGGGPGARGRTALGMDDSGLPLDRSELSEVPWWFVPFVRWVRHIYESEFSTMSTLRALTLLESAGIPPLYRLGLGVRWQFADWLDQNFSLDDFAQVLIAHPECEIGVSSEQALYVLNKIEERSTYRIWRRFGSSVLSSERKENAARSFVLVRSKGSDRASL